MPTMVQAGVYSAVTHYLKAVHELKSDADGAAVVAKMKAMPTDDKLFGKGTIRAGRPQDPRHVSLRGQEARRRARRRGTTTSCAPPSRPRRPSGPLDQGDCPLVK